MILKVYALRFMCIIFAAALLAGCSSRGRHAPVTDRGSAAKKVALAGVQRDQSDRPRVYVIEKGDTLYSIAFSYGLDYREISELNNIENPDVIYIGQEIRLFPDGDLTPVKQIQEIKPVQENNFQPTYVKEWPKAIRLNYSEQAIKQIEKMQTEIPKAAPVLVAKAENNSGKTTDEGDGELTWGMPTTGKILGGFSESANRKGIDIAGDLGQAIVASAAGKVVYSGNGLRGYGKLVIIKHNKTYLSAYAHNDQVLVKEGQNVSKGQRIAAMGKTDADQVKLHFEIRKFGKPVDPAKYLAL